MKGTIEFSREPRKKGSILIAAWPGVGNVSLILAQYLRDKLKASEIGEVLPFRFYDPAGVRVRANIVESPHYPANVFYLWERPDAGPDVIFLLGDEQPPSRSHELARVIVEMAIKYKVSRIFTFAAVLTKSHHTDKPQVWGAVNNPVLLEELKGYPVLLKGEIQIAGLNGLLLGVAREKKVDGICLLAEVPAYIPQFPNPNAALSIAEVLDKMLDLKVDLEELTEIARKADEEIKIAASHVIGQFIDQFTKPVWEDGAGDS